MRKIPILILSLTLLASNYIGMPVFALKANQIAVKATVLEHLTIRHEGNNIIIETNSKNGFYYLYNKQYYSAEKSARITPTSGDNLVIFARY